MKKFCALFSFLILVKTLFGQTAPGIEWQNTIGGDGVDALYSVHETSDRGYILGGWSESEISDDKTESYSGLIINRDYWIVKLDSNNNIEWDNTIGGSRNDELRDLKITSDHGYILGGFSISGNGYDKTEGSVGLSVDYWIVKVNDVGEIEWQNTIGGSADDYLNSINETEDGGYIVSGSTYSNASGDKSEDNYGQQDFWILKLDSTGNIEWQNTIGGTSDDVLEVVLQTADNGYIAAGYSNSGISGDKTETSIGGYDYWIIKLDSTGTIEWDNTIGGSSTDYLYSIAQTPEGGFILGGESLSGISGDKTDENKGPSTTFDYWILKLNSAGSIQWQKTIGGNEQDQFGFLRILSEGGYLVGGFSASGISGDKTEMSFGHNDWWILKLTKFGIIEWQTTIGGDYVDYLYSGEQTEDEGFIFGGLSYSGISGNKTEENIGGGDYWIIKLYPETNPCSAAPAGLYADFLSSSTAKLHWNVDPDAIKYKIQYRKNTVTTWTNTSATSNVKNLFSLEPSTTYKFRVKSNCGAGILSDWSNVATFTTLPLREGEDPDFRQDDIVVSVYPNPTSGTINLEFDESLIDKPVNISIKNLLGEEVFSEQFISSFTQHQIQLDKNISNGMYVVQIATGEKIFSQQILVSK